MINTDAFTSRIGPDILMNVLKDYIYIPCLVRLGFNFHLKQKQRFSSLELYLKCQLHFLPWKNVKGRGSMEGEHGSPVSPALILPIYSEKNKFKTSKDLTFKNYQKHTKKAGFKSNFSYKQAACFIGYSL